jgi:hypothetical protein
MPWRAYLRAIFLSESDFGPSRKEKEIKPKAVRDKISGRYEKREEEIHYCCKWGEK